MKKNLLLVVIFYFVLIISSYGAASSGNGGSTNYYKKGETLIKRAKKLEKKGKIEKANKRYKKALEYLIKSHKEKPDQPDTLNYLGFATRKLGDYEKGRRILFIRITN